MLRTLTRPKEKNMNIKSLKKLDFKLLLKVKLKEKFRLKKTHWPLRNKEPL